MYLWWIVIFLSLIAGFVLILFFLILVETLCYPLVNTCIVYLFPVIQPMCSFESKVWVLQKNIVRPCFLLLLYYLQYLIFICIVSQFGASLVTQMVKNPPANAGNLGLIPSQGDPLEKGIATDSGFLVWRIPWTEEPGRLQVLGSQRVSVAQSCLTLYSFIYIFYLLLVFYTSYTFQISPLTLSFVLNRYFIVSHFNPLAVYFVVYFLSYFLSMLLYELQLTS